MVSQRLIPLKEGKGRVAAVEVMLNSPLIADLIFKGEVHEIKEIMKKSRELGMQTFDQALFDLYEAGKISYEDALRNADSLNDLRLAIKLQLQGSEEPRHHQRHRAPQHRLIRTSPHANGETTGRSTARSDRAGCSAHPARDRTMFSLETHVSDITHVIQLAVAPVFLLTAVGTMLAVLTNRLSRVVDRSRVVENQLTALDGESLALTHQELQVLARRIRLIYAAIALAVVCAIFVCLLIAAAFLGAFVSVDLSRLLGALFVLAMLALVAALTVFLREIFLAVTSASRAIR